ADACLQPRFAGPAEFLTSHGEGEIPDLFRCDNGNFGSSRRTHDQNHFTALAGSNSGISLRGLGERVLFGDNRWLECAGFKQRREFLEDLSTLRRIEFSLVRTAQYKLISVEGKNVEREFPPSCR